MTLDTVRLGVVDGYAYWDKLDEYINANKDPKVIRFTGDTPLANAIDQLREGKIDALPENFAVFKWTIKQKGYPNTDFRIVHVHKNEPIYIAFAKTEAGKKHARLFDEGIRKLRASGELEKLLSYYDLTDWK